MSWLKQLFGLLPDVIIYRRDSELSLHRSYIIAGRRFVDYGGTQLLLREDGTVVGCSWMQKWEAL